MTCARRFSAFIVIMFGYRTMRSHYEENFFLTRASDAIAPASTAIPPARPPAPVPPGVALNAYQGDPNFMTSLARGLCVIQAFSQKTPQMTISQISLRTGLSRAAVRRCLYTLTKLGFAGSEDGQRYSLRPRILTLSNTYTASNTLSQSAQPILDRMSAQLHESCSVVTLDGDDIVYIARTTVTRIMSADLHIGSRLPAFCTSMGRCLLAYLPPEQLEAYLARVDLHRYTTRTVNSIEKLRMLLRSTRRAGYTICDQELEVGLRSVAVPVQAPSGRVVAAINVSGQAQRMPLPEMQTAFLPHLRAAAAELGMCLR
jgi:IclR family pca regulon transcriptional regulator